MNNEVLPSIFLVLIIGIINCGHQYNEWTGDGLVTVGVYVDEGASGIGYGAAEKMFEWMGFEIEVLFATNINEGNLDDIDIFYFPGGNGALYDTYINDTGKQRLRDLIDDGRAFIGTCGGAYFAAHYLNIFPATVGAPVPGLDLGMCQVYLIKPHPITNDLPAFFWIMYANSPFFEPDSDAVIDTIGFYNVSGFQALVACEYGEGRV